MPLTDFTTPRRTISFTARQRLPPLHASLLPSFTAWMGLTKGSRLCVAAGGVMPSAGAAVDAAAVAGFALRTWCAGFLVAVALAEEAAGFLTTAAFFVAGVCPYITVAASRT